MPLFQPRGPIILRPLDALLVPGAGFELCCDTITVSPKVSTWTHVNKCGLADAEDARGINSVSCDGSVSFATKLDRDRALAFLGTANAAAGSPSSVSGEAIIDDPRAGQIMFLGGKTRHRNITGLVMGALVLNTDYTLDPDTGKVVFLVDVDTSPNPTAAYSHTDPKAVSILTAAVQEYALDMEGYNREAQNKKFSLELYRTRFDPTSTGDFLPNQQQDMTMAFSCLVDTTRDVLDTVFGQFGRIVNAE